MTTANRTLLDHFVSTCVHNVNLPVLGEMAAVVQDVQPVPHRWCGWKETEPQPLPPTIIDWPDTSFCLFAPNTPIYPGSHRFCVDIDYTGPGFDPWFQEATWQLEGAFVFQLDGETFDVIPLAVEATQRMIVLPEMQLHYTLDDTGWAWAKADSGPVNALFHSFFMKLIADEDQDDVYDAINMLGNTMSMYLGAYHHWLQQPGEWDSRAPKRPRAKVKDGKVKKIYDEGTAGYKEYRHTTGE